MSAPPVEWLRRDHCELLGQEASPGKTLHAAVDLLEDGVPLANSRRGASSWLRVVRPESSNWSLSQGSKLTSSTAEKRGLCAATKGTKRRTTLNFWESIVECVERTSDVETFRDSQLREVGAPQKIYALN